MSIPSSAWQYGALSNFNIIDPYQKYCFMF